MIKVALLFPWYVKVTSTEIPGHCRHTKMVWISLKSVGQLMKKVPKNFHDRLGVFPVGRSRSTNMHFCQYVIPMDNYFAIYCAPID